MALLRASPNNGTVDITITSLFAYNNIKEALRPSLPIIACGAHKNVSQKNMQSPNDIIKTFDTNITGVSPLK